MGKTGAMILPENPSEEGESPEEIISGDASAWDSLETLVRRTKFEWEQRNPGQEIPPEILEGAIEVAIDHNKRKGILKIKDGKTKDPKE